MKNKKINILFIDHTPFVGGAQLSLLQHIEELDKKIFNPIIVCSCLAEDNGMAERYHAAAIKYYYIDFVKLKPISINSIIKLFKSSLLINKIIKKENINLIVSNTVRADIVASLSSLLMSRKLIWFIRDFTFPLKLFKVLSIFPRKIIFNSIATADYYKKANKKEKIEIIYVGRKSVPFFVKDEEIRKIKRIFNIKDGDFVVGFIGRLVDWKGPQVLIKAIDLLSQKKINNIKCLIIGSGKGQEKNNEEELKNMVKQLSLEKKIIFTGFQENINLFFNILDVFTLTSIEPEPFGASVIEAMMARVPVISTNIGGVAEVVKNNYTGLSVSPNKPLELSDAIIKILNNNDFRQSVINNAYSYALKNHSIEHITKKIESVYCQVLGK